MQGLIGKPHSLTAHTSLGLKGFNLPGHTHRQRLILLLSPGSRSLRHVGHKWKEHLGRLQKRQYLTNVVLLPIVQHDDDL